MTKQKHSWKVEKMRPNLKQARLDKGMTQQQVADHLGISLRHYQRMESGEIIGFVELWDDLEDLFNVHQRVLRQQDQVSNLPTHQG